MIGFRSGIGSDGSGALVKVARIRASLHWWNEETTAAITVTPIVIEEMIRFALPRIETEQELGERDEHDAGQSQVQSQELNVSPSVLSLQSCLSAINAIYRPCIL